MLKQAQKVIAGVAVLAAVAVGAAAVAGAASNDNKASGSSTHPRQAMPPGGHGPGEKLLTGATAAKVKKAAQDEVRGRTIIRVETDSDGSPYEAHVRKASGEEVVVKVDRTFRVTGVQGFPGPGGPRRGSGPAMFSH